MLASIISAFILSLPPSITSQEEWSAPIVTVTEDWSLNVIDRIQPVSIYLGDVFGVESDDGFHWHTVLVADGYVLHFKDDDLVDSLTYYGDVKLITFSPNHRYLLLYSELDKTIKLFDLVESTAKSEGIFSRDMALSEEPSLRVTDNGNIVVTQLEFLRIYDSDLNIVFAGDDFRWHGRFIGMSGDGSRMYSCNSSKLRAFSNNGDELWCTDLPESGSNPLFRYFTVSNTGRYIAMTDHDVICLFNAINGNIISRYSGEAHYYQPEFSPNDEFMLIGEDTRPGFTLLRPVTGFGLLLMSSSENDLESVSEFYSSESGENIPSDFSNYRVANNGNAVGMLYYRPGFLKIALLSNETDLIWMSGNASIPPYMAWFIDHQQGISPDGTKLWYFDGVSVHSCVVNESS